MRATEDGEDEVEMKKKVVHKVIRKLLGHCAFQGEIACRLDKVQSID